MQNLIGDKGEKFISKPKTNFQKPEITEILQSQLSETTGLRKSSDFYINYKRMLAKSFESNNTSESTSVQWSLKESRTKS